jgi:hypothetical protein
MARKIPKKEKMEQSLNQGPIDDEFMEDFSGDIEDPSIEQFLGDDAMDDDVDETDPDMIASPDLSARKAPRGKNRDLSQRFKDALDDYYALKTKFSELDLKVPLTTDRLIYLGGFVEGEGSININIRPNSKGPRFKVAVDPEFGVYQSNRNIQHLFTLWRYMKAGTVFVGKLKPSKGRQPLDPTLPLNYDKASYRISSRREIQEKAIPFIKEYLLPYAGPYFQNRFKLWNQAVEMFDNEEHRTAVGMFYKMAPAVTELRVITPRSDAKIPLGTLPQLQDYLRARFKEILLSNTASVKFTKRDLSQMSDKILCETLDKYYPAQEGSF